MLILNVDDLLSDNPTAECASYCPCRPGGPYTSRTTEHRSRNPSTTLVER